MSAEKQLRTLESDIKSLKASYPVAGSKVKFYVQTSQEFVLEDPPAGFVRFKFTPTYGLGKVSYTKLRAVIMIGDAPTGYTMQVNEPQDGSGETILKVQIVPYDPFSPTRDFHIRIIASGTSTGSFTML